ncbi:hypothetical protein HN011_011000 [Eciton burchellii]|nr:hypothetical protein HN011_011000 [Eciton burchellii]
MYLDDLLGLLNREESIKDFATYAHHLCILISGNSCRKLEIKINIAIRTINIWCQRYEMISPIKIQAIIFGKRLKKKPRIKLGTINPNKTTYKISVILDQKVNFSKHVFGESEDTIE